VNVWLQRAGTAATVILLALSVTSLTMIKSFQGSDGFVSLVQTVTQIVDTQKDMINADATYANTTLSRYSVYLGDIDVVEKSVEAIVLSTSAVRVLVLAQVQQRTQLLMGLAASGVCSLFGIVIKAVIKYVSLKQPLHTQSLINTNMFNHITSASILNSLMAPLLVALVRSKSVVSDDSLFSSDPITQDWYEPGGAVTVGVTMIIYAFLFEELLKLQPVTFLKRLWARMPFCPSDRFSVLWRAPELSLPLWYGSLTKNIALVLIYAPFYPPMYLLAGFYMVGSYWCVKFAICKVCKRPPKLSPLMMRQMLEFVRRLVWLHVLSLLITSATAAGMWSTWTFATPFCAAVLLLVFNSADKFFQKYFPVGEPYDSLEDVIQGTEHSDFMEEGLKNEPIGCRNWQERLCCIWSEDSAIKEAKYVRRVLNMEKEGLAAINENTADGNDVYLMPFGKYSSRAFDSKSKRWWSSDSNAVMHAASSRLQAEGKPEDQRLCVLLDTFEVLKMRVFCWHDLGDVARDELDPKGPGEQGAHTYLPFKDGCKCRESDDLEVRVKAWLDAFEIAGCPLIETKYTWHEPSRVHRLLKFIHLA